MNWELMRRRAIRSEVKINNFILPITKMDIQKIQDAVKQDIFFREYAIQKMVEREITEEHVIEAIENGEIIEEYPQDK